jgi:hypothetical protein
LVVLHDKFANYSVSAQAHAKTTEVELKAQIAALLQKTVNAHDQTSRKASSAWEVPGWHIHKYGEPTDPVVETIGYAALRKRTRRVASASEGRGVTGKHHDLVNFTKKYKGDSHSFFLDMKNWRKFKTRYNLNWQKLRFGDASHHSVPKERGIYAFTLELAQCKLPLHGYILYIGITGDDSSANLYKRYAQYLLNLKNEDGRPAVFYMMDNWPDDLFFNFVPLPNKKIDLAKLEKDLLNALIPPVNKKDLGATITAAKAAAF